MKITKITRRDLFGAMTKAKVNWAGSLEETEFLDRLYDLERLPTTDNRFPNAAGDIWQHRTNNNDWSDDWVFYDERFELMEGDKATLLNFLAETVHPEVRPDVEESRDLVTLYNKYLKNDGFEIAERERISGKPVYASRNIGVPSAPGVAAAKESLSGTDLVYVKQQIERMEAAIQMDPCLAIGTAKELLETCCKTILSEREVDAPASLTFPQLVKKTVKELQLAPDDIPDGAKAVDVIRRLLSNLGSVAGGIAELRNSYGTGHGRPASSKGLRPRHAKLAVGAASTLAVFLVETHRERQEEAS